MINKEGCLFLGTLARPHGTKGAVLILLKDIKAEEIKKRDTVFVDIDGLLVPFFIEEFRISSSDSVIVKFERINDETGIKTFLGNAVYVLPEQVAGKRKQSEGLYDLRGYKVYDKTLGFRGIAGDINDIINNPLLQVIYEDKDFYIPFHEDIVLKINKKEKIIIVDAPEGLFDL